MSNFWGAVQFGVTLFLTELDRCFWGTSGMRSVSIEGKVRCRFLREGLFARSSIRGKYPIGLTPPDSIRCGDARMCRIQEKQECQNLHI